MIKLEERSLPTKPGVYLFRDKKGEVLYVGKAKNLRKRVEQYFHKEQAITNPRLFSLRSEAHSIETIITNSEVEALILENTLIKKEQPKYNVSLKDDKQYTYVKITKEEFPRLLVVHQPVKDGSKYLGPYMSADRTRWLLKTLRRAYPYCLAPRDARFGRRACLYVHLGLCPGPCMGKVTPEAYRRNVSAVVHFLRGEGEATLADLRREMRHAAKFREFERAAILRDTVSNLEVLFAKQEVVSPRRESMDILALARAGNSGVLVTFQIREGKLMERQTRVLDHMAGVQEGEVYALAITERATQNGSLPRAFVMPVTPADGQVLTRLLAERAKAFRAPPPHLVVPERGRMRRLIALAQKNAQEELARILRERGGTSEALADLRMALDLPRIPHRIEAYDLSNIQGVYATGSLVVFEDGKPAKSDYRRFRIKTVEGANDVAMMEEVLSRRLKYLSTTTRHELRATSHAAWFIMPDLLLLDGGKPQLGAGLRALKAFHLSIPVAALAKREEELFIPGKRQPVRLPKNSPALHLVQRVRDEAHRFARAYYQKLHRKAALL